MAKRLSGIAICALFDWLRISESLRTWGRGKGRARVSHLPLDWISLINLRRLSHKFVRTIMGSSEGCGLVSPQLLYAIHTQASILPFVDWRRTT